MSGISITRWRRRAALGVIAGDIAGSVFECSPINITPFPLFSKYFRLTDDTVLTIAVAHAILSITGGVDSVFDTPCQGTILESIIAFLE